MAEKTDDDDLMSWEELGELLAKFDRENPDSAGAYALMMPPGKFRQIYGAIDEGEEKDNARDAGEGEDNGNKS